MTIAISFVVTMNANAQLKVNSSGSVIMPNNVIFKTEGNLYFPGSQDIRFGGDATGANPNWSIENINGGLNFWKPAGTNIGDYKLFLKDDGYVGIGTNAPTGKLDVIGWKVRFSNNSSLVFYTNNTDPRICSNTNQVVFYKADNTGYVDIEVRSVIESSDSTKKKNIKVLDGSLQKVLKLKGYNYNWKDDVNNSEKQSGLLAQEVEKIIPEVVSTVDSSKGKAISYTHIIPYLIEAIKEQNTTIDSLKKLCKNNDNVQSKIAQLESQLASIQNCCDSKGNSKTKSFDESETATPNEQSSIPNSELQSSKAKLYQNAPNPFKESTTIKLEIPESVKKAMVCIYDLNGHQLKCLNVNGYGTTSVQVFGNELTAGMYHYVLIVDGFLIDNKTMILTE